MNGKLKKNIIYQMVYQLVILVSPLIVTPYISRVLGPTELGKYSYAYSLAYYFVLFGTLGITMHGSRQIANTKDNDKEFQKTFSNLFWLHLVISCFALLFYILSILYGMNSANSGISWIMTFYVASTLFDVKWLFQGLEEFKITVLRSLIVKIVSIILIFNLVKQKGDVNQYTFIMAFVSFFMAEFSLFILTPKKVKLLKPNFKDMKKEFTPLLIMFVPTFAALICRHIDKVMLGMLSTYEQVGLYENTDKIYMILVSFITTIGDVMLPRMSNLISKGNAKHAKGLFSISLRLCVITSCAFTFGIIAIAPEFVIAFLGDAFAECVILIRVISPTIIMLAFSATIRKQYLIPRYKNKVFIISTVIGCIFNIIVNLILITRLGALGAVYGTLIAEFAIMLIQFLMIRKELTYGIYIKDLFFFSIIGIIMFIGVRVLSLWILDGWILVLAEISLGALIFIVLSFCYFKLNDDELLIKLVNSISKRR